VKKKQQHSLSCDACGSRCCRYVATEIHKPTCKRDVDNIRWYLLHEAINVFIDRNNLWYVEFQTDCSGLAPNSRCLVYKDRPKICARYGEDGDDCEFHGDAPPHKRSFSTVAEFEKYLKKKGVDWRWRQ